jgi:flagellar hook assembly protein FlgD
MKVNRLGGFRSFQNTHPFNARTIIGYSLPEQSSVCIDIYDLLGRKVETLNQGIQPAGHIRAIWDGSRFSSGMYLISIDCRK